MSTADCLTVLGLGATSVGSILGMAGIFMQTNAYYPFKTMQLIGQAFKVPFKVFYRSGREELIAEAKLSEHKPEDRFKSLVGLYFVFWGFLLQLLGGVLLFAAVFAAPASPR